MRSFSILIAVYIVSSCSIYDTKKTINKDEINSGPAHAVDKIGFAPKYVVMWISEEYRKYDDEKTHKLLFVK